MALATLGLLDGLSKGPTPVQFPYPAAADSADEKGGWEETQLDVRERERRGVRGR